MPCVRCRVSGRVQGVWFRAETQRQARSLGIRGYAANRADGSVEVLACGEPLALERLRAWLQQGPPLARVANLECQDVADAAPEGFDTR
jgi:acylphosphatase